MQCRKFGTLKLQCLGEIYIFSALPVMVHRCQRTKKPSGNACSMLNAQLSNVADGQQSTSNSAAAGMTTAKQQHGTLSGQRKRGQHGSSHATARLEAVAEHVQVCYSHADNSDRDACFHPSQKRNWKALPLENCRVHPLGRQAAAVQAQQNMPAVN
eukprot:GHRQ01015022.1.p2 GENE.GHRQ01015022.1~~GHRQ01015022.1.p2  ORF type:complete len:156 (-),score=21.85 GHRQ01015022.1:371-838(-)